MKFSRTKILLLSWLLSLSYSTAWAYTITTFSDASHAPSSAVLNANLGVTGYVIEDFEDTTFVPGFSLLFLGFSVLDFSSSAASETWDGTRSFSFTTDSSISSTEFSFLPQGVSSFGIGLIDMDFVQEVEVNGSVLLPDITTDASYDSIGRNIYIRIDQDAADSAITSVILRETTAAANAYFFDHLAFVPAVPEPATAPLTFLAMGIAGLIAWRSRRTKQNR